MKPPIRITRGGTTLCNREGDHEGRYVEIVLLGWIVHIALARRARP